MARGINKVILVGNRAWKDKDGVQQEQTEWHRVVFFNKLAEIVGKYVVKGSKLYCEGSLRTNKWQDKDGNDRYTTEIIANEMQMLDSKGDAGHSDGQLRTPTEPQVTQVDNEMPDNFDEDIPF
jgi:single-strand DNA-binding protein